MAKKYYIKFILNKIDEYGLKYIVLNNL